MREDTGLTFAGIESLKPHIMSVSVGSTSTLLIPSAFRSATTNPAGFFKSAALWAYHIFGGRDGHCFGVSWCAA